MTIKQKLSRNYKQFLFHLSAKNNSLYLSFYKHLYKPKPGTISAFANRFSRDNPGLTIIQVGANDGFNHDPVHKFIKRDGWKGVLLEPQPEVYEQFLKPLHFNNKAIITLNAALNYEDGEQTMYKIAFSKARWASGLTSFKRSVLEDAIESGHVARCAAKEGISLPAIRNDYIEEFKIKCISPVTLMKKYNINNIDWLQIDTEGFDFEIIKMFQIDKTRPRVIVFEHSHLSEEDLALCYQHLEHHNYAYKKYGGNTLAMSKPASEYQTFFELPAEKK